MNLTASERAAAEAYLGRLARQVDELARRLETLYNEMTEARPSGNPPAPGQAAEDATEAAAAAL
jgi:hypothetical protein